MEVPESTVRRVGYVGEVFFNHLSDVLGFLTPGQVGDGGWIVSPVDGGGGVLEFLNLWLGWGLVIFSPSAE